VNRSCHDARTGRKAPEKQVDIHPNHSNVFGVALVVIPWPPRSESK
jgi:hypothetical protein